jgi:hypothetical protein
MYWSAAVTEASLPERVGLEDRATFLTLGLLRPLLDFVFFFEGAIFVLC